MHNLLKFGTCLGVVISLTGCGTSEHFMQDDVYNTRTPIMPPGTDLNDVTDYATFVAKKEQSQTPEKTTYVSPRQYNDYFYNSQYIYYGYSPYGALTGLGYYGYGSYYNTYHNGIFYPSIGFGSYYGSSGSYYYHPYNGYYGLNPYTPYYGCGGYYSGNSYSYTPIGKPNTGGNMGNVHAGTASGRMGSTTGGGFVNYENKLIAKPATHGFTGVGRNTTINSSPVVSGGRNPGANTRETVRPVSPGRTSVPTERTSSGTYRRVESTPNSGGNNRTINTNSTPRTSSPTLRSGSSGGSISSPGSGGSRSGGRR